VCQVTSYCLLQQHPFEHSFSSCSLRAIRWSVIREDCNVWQFSWYVVFVYLASFGNRVEILCRLLSSCWSKNVQVQQYTVNFKYNLASLKHCCRGFDSQSVWRYRSAVQYLWWNLCAYISRSESYCLFNDFIILNFNLCIVKGCTV
jgi:hypothetical protein